MIRQQFLESNNQGYYCKFCNSYNDILTNPCWNCKGYQEVIPQVAVSVIRVSRTGEFYPMDDDKIEKHAKYFNSTVVLCSNMTDEQLDAHIRELSDICFVGRAQLNGAQQVKRERVAKLSPKSREWLVSADNDADVSDALAAVKTRKDRMSKADKLADAMKSLGLSGTDVTSLMSNVAKTAKDSDLNKITYNKSSNGNNKTVISELCRLESHETCTGSFHAEGKSNQCECKCHTTKSKWDEPDDNPDKSIEDLFK